MLTKIARAHLNNAKAARKSGHKKLARQFLRFARNAMARAS